jgi:sec-independent protein translocase protein TatA
MLPFNLGGPELIIVLVIVLIVFGAGKLPNVMRDVGRGVKEFKKAQSDEEREAADQAAMTTTTAAPPPPSTVSSNAPSTNGAAGSSVPRSAEPAPRA